ncbi:TPA: hypothetical protein ACH3X1_001086 [Trebouxia sp. C0004]
MALVFQPGGKHLSRHILIVAGIGATMSLSGVYMVVRWVTTPRVAKESTGKR